MTNKLITEREIQILSQEQRKQKSDRDEIMKETILKALRFRNRKKGACQIKITLAGAVSSCLQFKANPYKRMLKATKEHRVVPNRLKWGFK